MRTWRITVLALLSGAGLAFGEAPPATLTHLVTVDSKVLGEHRQAFVHVPGVGQITEKRYPVLYVLDGHELFWLAVGTMDYLSKQNRMPAMIVVGIANTDRRRDLAPTGGANRFLQFVEEELFPAVEQRFPTAPYRVLAGHSLGGTLALHALLVRSHLFGGYVAASPNLRYEEDLVERWTREPWSERKQSAALYVVMGDRDELSGSVESFRRLRAALQAAPPGMTAHAEELAGVDHMTTREDFLLRGLPRLFEGWSPTDAEGISPAARGKAEP